MSDPVVTKNQLDMMRHAVGNKGTGRNRYCAGGDDIAQWDSLVEMGFAAKFKSSIKTVGPMYYVTGPGYELLGLKAGVK